MWLRLSDLLSPEGSNWHHWHSYQLTIYIQISIFPLHLVPNCRAYWLQNICNTQNDSTWLFFLSNSDFLNILNAQLACDQLYFYYCHNFGKYFRKTISDNQIWAAVSNDWGYGGHCVSLLPPFSTLRMPSPCRGYDREIINFNYIITMMILWYAREIINFNW